MPCEALRLCALVATNLNLKTVDSDWLDSPTKIHWCGYPKKLGTRAPRLSSTWAGIKDLKQSIRSIFAAKKDFWGEHLSWFSSPPFKLTTKRRKQKPRHKRMKNRFVTLFVMARDYKLCPRNFKLRWRKHKEDHNACVVWKFMGKLFMYTLLFLVVAYPQRSGSAKHLSWWRAAL